MTAQIIEFPAERARPARNALINDISIVSRYAVVHEVQTMAEMLRQIGNPIVLAGIDSIHCDSNASALYTVNLRPECLAPINRVGAYIAMAARIVGGGYNGIYVIGADGQEWFLDADWFEELDEIDPQPA